MNYITRFSFLQKWRGESDEKTTTMGIPRALAGVPPKKEKALIKVGYLDLSMHFTLHLREMGIFECIAWKSNSQAKYIQNTTVVAWGCAYTCSPWFHWSIFLVGQLLLTRHSWVLMMLLFSRMGSSNCIYMMVVADHWSISIHLKCGSAPPAVSLLNRCRRCLP